MKNKDDKNLPHVIEMQEHLRVVNFLNEMIDTYKELNRLHTERIQKLEEKNDKLRLFGNINFN